MTATSHPARKAPVVLIGGVGASLASVSLFGMIADEVWEHETMALDTRVIEEAREMRSPALDRLMSAATATGEPWALAVVGSLVLLRWRGEGRTADAVSGGLALAGAAGVNQILKLLFRRDRPALSLRRAHASGYSFPSGHAMTTVATYGALAYLAGRRGGLTGRPAMRLVAAPVALLCALVGASRVYLEVHYPTDVIAGWAAGTVWLTTCALARSVMEPEES